MMRQAGTRQSARRVLPVLWAIPFLVASFAAAQGEDCVGFDERTVQTGGTNGAHAVFSTDLDGDGDTDLVVGSFNDDKILWFENLGGNPPQFLEHVITADADGAVSVFAADLDNDGDQDVLSASSYDDTIAWYENVGGSPPIFFQRVITNQANHAMEVFAADMDFDGDIDVFSASYVDGTVAWYENLIGGEILDADFEEHIITTEAWGASSIHAADIDGDSDGFLEVVSQSIADNKIAWYKTEWGVELDENDQEVPVLLYTKHLVEQSVASVRSVRAHDVDGDGDTDLLSASPQEDSVAWYANDGANPPVFTRVVMAADAEGAKMVRAADLDGDQDLDVFVAAERSDAILWFENDGAQPPAFVERLIPSVAESPDAVWIDDVDSDGLLDVIAAASVPGPSSRNDKVVWFENDGATPPELAEHVVGGVAEGARSIVTADIDADGDLDLVWAGGRSKVAWSESDGQPRPSFTPRVISSDAIDSSDVFVADLDSDGDLDVLSASVEDDKIAWYESDGAQPPSFVEHVISTDADEARSVYAADVDGDGDLDVLSASSGDDKIAWYQSDGGTPPSFVEHVLASDSEETEYVAVGARAVRTGYINDDLFLDVIAGSAGDGKISWYENDGAQPPEIPSFTERIIASDDPYESLIRATGVTSIDVADVDGDGDLDVSSVSPVDNTVVWYQNQPNPQVPTARQFALGLVTEFEAGVRSIRNVDIDDDGDIDLLTSAPGTNDVAWFENDGNYPPEFFRHFVGDSSNNPLAAYAGDLTGDDKLDIAAGYSFEIYWYERVGELCAGFDANGDSRIDGTELAWLARAFGRAVNDPDAEWWASVDFNQDGIVNGDDLAILASVGVWGATTDLCQYTCR